MADPTTAPSTLDKLAAFVEKVELYVPGPGGAFLKIADIGLHALAAALDSSGADLSALNSEHAEYLRRKAIAADPKS